MKIKYSFHYALVKPRDLQEKKSVEQLTQENICFASFDDAMFNFQMNQSFGKTTIHNLFAVYQTTGLIFEDKSEELTFEEQWRMKTPLFISLCNSKLKSVLPRELIQIAYSPELSLPEFNELLFCKDYSFDSFQSPESSFDSVGNFYKSLGLDADCKNNESQDFIDSNSEQNYSLDDDIASLTNAFDCDFNLAELKDDDSIKLREAFDLDLSRVRVCTFDELKNNLNKKATITYGRLITKLNIIHALHNRKRWPNFEDDYKNTIKYLNFLKTKFGLTYDEASSLDILNTIYSSELFKHLRD